MVFGLPWILCGGVWTLGFFQKFMYCHTSFTSVWCSGNSFGLKLWKIDLLNGLVIILLNCILFCFEKWLQCYITFFNLPSSFFRYLIKHVVSMWSKTEFLYGVVITDQHNRGACNPKFRNCRVLLQNCNIAFHASKRHVILVSSYFFVVDEFISLTRTVVTSSVICNLKCNLMCCSPENMKDS